MGKQVEITINNQKYKVEEGINLLQACDKLGIQVPRFCYHDELTVAGNCRMCLVNIKGAPKPLASCTTVVTENMEVTTEDAKLHEVREGMLELLLINHPLDCPVCDQAGECDLQDLTKQYGFYENRLNVDKRAVSSKDMGPVINTKMDRCIHCTRCVRFTEDVMGNYALGTLGRGATMEIDSCIFQSIDDELSGNLVDLCPVGAITSKQYSTIARPWELNSKPNVDIMDAAGSSIMVNYFSNTVMRILPKHNNEINGNWISNKSRYIVDALKLQRLDTPWIRKNNKLVPCSWEEALESIKNRTINLHSNDIGCLAGQFIDNETLLILKKLVQMKGIENYDSRYNGAYISTKDRYKYIFNTKIENIENCDVCLIIGSNVKTEAPVINAKIRKAYLEGNMKIFYLGPKIDLNYNYTYLGDSCQVLSDLLLGNNYGNAHHELSNAKNPMIILGQGAFRGVSIKKHNTLLDAVIAIANKYGVIKKDDQGNIYNGYNMLHSCASRVGALDVGFYNDNHSYYSIIDDFYANRIKTIWLVNTDDDVIVRSRKSGFIIYQGHHGNLQAQEADVILPSSMWLEKESTFTNTEGRVQLSSQVVEKLGQARHDVDIILDISKVFNIELPYKNISDVSLALQELHPAYKNISTVVDEEIEDINTDLTEELALGEYKVLNIIDNYYLNDILSKHSKLLAKCYQYSIERKEVK